MRMPCRAIAVFFAAALPCAWLAADDGEPALTPAQGNFSEVVAAPRNSEEIAAGAPRFRYVGTASCATANCHGGDGARPVRDGGDPFSPQAYSIWIQRDPHAGSYDVLYRADSQRMAERLGWQNAYTAKVCLNCHAINASKSELTESARHTLHDGVGCEACHGAAEGWLDSHKWADWASKNPAEKSAVGYRDLNDVVQRAKVCAECHVGSEGRDVNHDLIAAGHPRMTFELSAYHANLPKHWKDEAISPDQLEARLWLVGQAVSAETSLALLSRRAADKQAPWPELSEYDCFACHHDLADPSWRQTEFKTSASLNPGGARWGSWHFVLAPLVRGEAPREGQDRLSELRIEMQRPLPRRDVVRALADQASRDFGEWAYTATRQSVGAAERAVWLSRLSDAQQFAPPDNWDSASQRFLGCAAMIYAGQSAPAQSRAGQASESERMTVVLERLRTMLQFREDSQSPQYDDPTAETAARKEVRNAFDELHRMLMPAPPVPAAAK